jgi:chromosome segregation ATPase
MTQIEFDKKMNEYRVAQQAELEPLKNEVERLNQKKRGIGYEIMALQNQLSVITSQRDAMLMQIKQTGERYWNLKHDLIKANPIIQGE